MDAKQIRERYAAVLDAARELQAEYVTAKAKLHELRERMQAADAEKKKIEAGAEMLGVSLKESEDVDVTSP